MPDPAPDEDVIRHRARRDIDHRDMVGRPQRDKDPRPVGRKAHPHGLQLFGADIRQCKADLGQFGLGRDIKDADRAADLGADP